MRYFIFLFLFLGCLVGCGSRNPDIELTLAPIETLTAVHENEVRLLIEHYWLGAFSLDVRKNPDQLSQYAVNPLLETLISFGTPLPESDLYVTSSVSLRKVIVLDYAPANIRAIACGSLHQDKVSYEGEYIEASNPIPIMSVFAFVRMAETWKLAAHYNFADTKGAIRDWVYVSSEEKQLIGDLPSYIDMYFDCRLN